MLYRVRAEQRHRGARKTHLDLWQQDIRARDISDLFRLLHTRYRGHGKVLSVKCLEKEAGK